MGQNGHGKIGRKLMGARYNSKDKTDSKVSKKIFSSSSINSKGFSKKLRSSFGVTYLNIRDVGMKQRVLKAKQDCLLWSYAKSRK